VKPELHSLLTCLTERYRVMERPPRKRKRVAAIDLYLNDLRSFTLRRVEAAPVDKRKFSLQRLADSLKKDYGREFHRSTVKRALERHQMYKLW
jgi:hypothetical protein